MRLKLDPSVIKTLQFYIESQTPVPRKGWARYAASLFRFRLRKPPDHVLRWCELQNRRVQCTVGGVICELPIKGVIPRVKRARWFLSECFGPGCVAHDALCCGKLCLHVSCFNKAHPAA